MEPLPPADRREVSANQGLVVLRNMFAKANASSDRKTEEKSLDQLADDVLSDPPLGATALGWNRKAWTKVWEYQTLTKNWLASRERMGLHYIEQWNIILRSENTAVADSCTWRSASARRM